MATVTGMTAAATQAALNLKANAADVTSSLAMKADASATLAKTNNLADVASKPTTRTNLNLQQRIVFDVRDYNAVGDGTTDDTTFIQNALNAATPGSTVFLPGNHSVTAPLKIPPQVCLSGSNGVHLDPAVHATLIPTATFSGAAVILVQDMTTGGYSVTSNEQHVKNLSINMTHIPGATVVDGIQVQGFVSGGALENLGIVSATGYGVNFVNNSSGIASSWRAFRVTVTSAAGPYAINATIDDSTWVDCEVKNCVLNGWQVGNSINSTFIGCRADNNTQNGFYFDTGDGISGYVGGPSFVGCSTNRNGQNGVVIPSAANGNAPISFTGCRFQRDGSTSTTSGYAAVNVNGSTQPVILTGCHISPGTNSDGSGNNSPQYGLSATSANVSINGGIWHAASEGIHDGGSNTYLRRGPNVVERTGTTSAPIEVVRGVQTTGGNTGHLDVPGYLAGSPSPASHGAVAWTADPTSLTGTVQPTAGRGYGTALYVSKKTPVTKLFWGLGTGTAGAGAVAGENWIAIYDSSGNRIVNVGIDGRVTEGVGLKTETINVTLNPGMYWVVWLFNATTIPLVLSTPSSSVAPASIMNFNLAVASSRSVWIATGATTLPSSFVPSSTITAIAFFMWAAVA